MPHQHTTNTARVEQPTGDSRPARAAWAMALANSHTGAESSYTFGLTGPLDHAIGRSRGGLSTKIHQLVACRGRPLVITLTAGQASDSTMLKPLLAQLAVRRVGPGRPRTRPQAVLSGKAHSSRGTRAMLRARGSRR